MNIVKLADVMSAQIQLLPPVSYPVTSACVYTNLLETSGAFGIHMTKRIYPAQVCQVPAVTLGKVSSEAMLVADESLVIGHSAVSEQLAPQYHDDAAKLDALPFGQSVRRVEGESLLIARFGQATWGHWLGELLPKVVLAEHFFPGRFKYVVSAAIVHNAHRPGLWKSIMDSLAAYGIGPDRLEPVLPQYNYTFSDLWAMSPIREDNIMFHPGAFEAMNHLNPAPSTGRRVALLRTDSVKRGIDNQLAVLDLLATWGYQAVDIGKLEFIEQVRCCRQASHIVSVLGSGLSGLIYSPLGVKVASLAPARFGDRFFYTMVQNRLGRYADVRGPIVSNGGEQDRDDVFAVPLDALEKGLSALDAV